MISCFTCSIHNVYTTNITQQGLRLGRWKPQVFYNCNTYSLILKRYLSGKCVLLTFAIKLPLKNDRSSQLHTWLKEVRAQKVPTHRFFENLARRKVMINYCQNGKKNWGLLTSFWREHAPKNTLNLKNRVSLADKATVSVSPKMLQLHLWIEIFSAKYCPSRPTKWN